MRFPFSFWKAGGFDPATLSLTGWWRANYGGAPWTPTASAGASGTDGNLVVGVAPTMGTTQNGFTPAAFNGTSQYLQTANAPLTYVTKGAGTIIVLAYVVSAPATSGTTYTDPTLFCTATSVEIVLSYSSGGFVCHYFDGAHHDTPAIAFSTGAYHLFQLTWDSTTVRARVDGGAATTVAAGAIDNLAFASMLMGTTYDSSTKFANVRILETMTAQTAFSTATLDNIRSYANSRYAISV